MDLACTLICPVLVMSRAGHNYPYHKKALVWLKITCAVALLGACRREKLTSAHSFGTEGQDCVQEQAKALEQLELCL